MRGQVPEFDRGLIGETHDPLLQPLGQVVRVIAPLRRDYAAWAGVTVLGMGFVVLFAALGGKKSDPIQTLTVGSLIVIAGSVAFAFLNGMFRRVEVRQHGLAERRFGRVVRTILYERSASVRVSVVRRRVEFIPVGTTISIRIADDDGTAIKASSWYRRLRGRIGPDGEDATTEDPNMELVLDVSRVILARWIDQLRSGDRIEWCKQLLLSRDGAELLRGRRRGELVPYSELQSIHQDTGHTTLVFCADRPQSLTVDSASENFLPGLMLLELASSSPLAAARP